VILGLFLASWQSYPEFFDATLELCPPKYHHIATLLTHKIQLQIFSPPFAFEIAVAADAPKHTKSHGHRRCQRFRRQ